MGAMSWWHWVIIIAAFVLIFGAKKLPDAARGVGRSLRILKSEVNAMHEESGKNASDAGAAVPPPAQITTPPPAAPLAQPATQPAAVPVEQPVAQPVAQPVNQAAPQTQPPQQ